MTEQVNWQDFDKLHVIRRLRQLVAKWWKVQINFTDAQGLLRGVPKGKFFNPVNEVCVGITGLKDGFLGCLSTVRQSTAQVTHEEKAVLSNCHAGFSSVIVPIRVGGKFLGCVFGDGFLIAESEVEQKVKIRASLRRFFKTENHLDKYIDALPVLSQKDVGYLTELIEIVVAEILLTEESLSVARSQVNELKNELGVRYKFENMVGKAASMQELYRMVEKVRDYDSLVLIQGENGTGKELIAKALHYNSKRAASKFLAVNCAAFNENLLESELFGHVKGAYTGAIKDKEGLFEASAGGTLFLDEIGDTSLAMQVKLLRVLQDGTFSPVGSTGTKQSTARIVCATNKDLAKAVKEGTFREDLFYRLNVINLWVPPLRERKEDIPLLVEHFLEKNSKGSEKKQVKISKTCLNALLNHSWPGNIRELENEVERLWVLCDDGHEISEEFLSPRIKSKKQEESFTPTSENFKGAISELECRLIAEGLKKYAGNKSQLAKALGISRASLIMKVEKFGLEKKS